MVDGAGREQFLQARVCKPAGTGPFPLAVLNHGAPPDAADVPLMVPPSCAAPAARWLLSRGFLVVAALRRGFGASTGPVAESSGPCGAPDYARAGREGARDIAAVVRYAAGLRVVARSGALVIGQSTGGWATIAYAAAPDPMVAGAVSMAGGRGGHALGRGDTYCRPERLVAAAAEFGRSSRLPMLWVSAANDSYFGPALVSAMKDAFDRGGGAAELVVTPPFGREGHALFTTAGGEAVWGPLVDTFLAGPAATTRKAG